MTRGAALALLVIGAASRITGQAAEPPERWFVNIRGPATIHRAELQLSPGGGRILLARADSVWYRLEDFRRSRDSLHFSIAAGDRRFALESSGELLRGTVTGTDGHVETVEASLIQPGTSRWPVPPRVSVGQLILGTADTVSAVPRDWMALADSIAAIPATAPPDGGWEALAAEASAEGEAALLGFTASGRRLATALLEDAARAGPDPDFDRLFRARNGGWRIDLHDVAWELALQYAPSDLEDTGELVDHLVRAGSGVGLVRGDTLALRRAVWQIWSRIHRTGQVPAGLLDASGDSAGTAVRGLRALLMGYDSAVSWWVAATRWFMSSRWLERGGGRTSVPELVSEFWDEEQSLPRIEPVAFGAAQAAPVVGVAPLAGRLVREANGSAGTWLERPGALESVISLWQQIEGDGDEPIRLVAGGITMPMLSPRAAARGRLGSLVAPVDAIRIDPAIAPALAVGTLIHEWHHLVSERRRLAAIDSVSWGMRIPDADPWVAEGMAEWATDRVTSGLAGAAGAYRLLEDGKRRAIGAREATGPHRLGYLLVRAAAGRVPEKRLRDLLVRHLADLPGLAAELGFAGSDVVRLRKPATLMIIPETSFTIDGGVADLVTRRILIPD